MKAVIFDMDGVLIDSEPLWKIAEVEGFGKVGLDLTYTDCEETVGLRIDEVVRLWHKKVGWENKSIEEVSEDIVDILIREIQTQGKALAGVYESLELLKSSDYKIGLATSSAQRIVDTVLQKLDIAHYFDATHSAEFELLGKPHPGVFLSCADQLNVHANDCLVIEDSFNGVVAARAARMKVVAIPEKSHQPDQRLIIADQILDSLHEFHPERVLHLWE